MASSKHLILGGGMVAGYAAKELAARGLKPGELTIVSADDSLPYERPPLSKSFLAGKDSEDAILINKSDWYAAQGINVKLRTAIDRVDLNAKRLRATSGDTFEFQNLLIATGMRARKIECPGNGLPNLFYLRSMNDSRKIRARAAASKRAVVIGGGFIGMEVASVLSQQNIDTSMVIPEDRVWSRIFTPALSEFFENYYHSRGVKLLKKESINSLKGSEPLEITLSSGRKLSCRPFVHVPYFFSDVFDLSYELWGDPDGPTQTVTRGDAKSSSFSVWWLRQNRVVAAFAMNRPDEERQAAPQWIESKQSVSADRLADDKRPITAATT